MQKTKIDWVKNPDGSQGYSWNPIKGLCPQVCWYCYARRMYKRFKWNGELSFNLDNPKEIDRLHRIKPRAGSRIFVCSTMEIFDPQIKKEWRDTIFKIIECNRCFTFIILTKLPENIDRPMPENVWLGRTMTFLWDYSEDDVEKFKKIKARKKFLSIEPMLGGIRPGDLDFKGIDWVICGRLTGHGKKIDPLNDWIKWAIEAARRDGCLIFLKNNLKEIWGVPLIQEMPG